MSGFRGAASGADMEEYTIPADESADFAVRVTGDELVPWLHDGDILLAERRADLTDGDVGLFLIGDELVWRQVCRDNLGNLHLLTLDRTRRNEDVFLPASAALSVTCYGKALFSEQIPLPTD